MGDTQGGGQSVLSGGNGQNIDSERDRKSNLWKKIPVTPHFWTVFSYVDNKHNCIAVVKKKIFIASGCACEETKIHS